MAKKIANFRAIARPLRAASGASNRSNLVVFMAFYLKAAPSVRSPHLANCCASFAPRLKHALLGKGADWGTRKVSVARRMQTPANAFGFRGISIPTPQAPK
jgi:hypothetical protein